jgi:hypothetical protein
MASASPSNVQAASARFQTVRMAIGTSVTNPFLLLQISLAGAADQAGGSMNDVAHIHPAA